MATSTRYWGFVLACVFLLTGCGKQSEQKAEFQMGDKARIGPLTYTAIESSWKSQLGDSFKLRTPERRFLQINISIANGSGKEISLPLFALENASGQVFNELDNGEGVANWLGLLRSIGAGQVLQGQILFDVPLTSYRLRLPDGGELGSEKYGYISIPLRMDVDTQVNTPLPGQLK